MRQEERFGKRIRELREQKGWTLRKASQAIGISHMRLGELEAGRARGTGNPTRPTREVAGRIAEAYSVPKDYLLELAGYAREHPELSDEDALMLDLFRSLDKRHRGMAVRILTAMKASET